jgi:small-conductance mechanosensitive channel
METTPPVVDISSAILFPGIVYGCMVLALTWFASGTLTRVLGGLGNRFTDKRLILNQVSTVVRFLLWLVGFAVAVALSLNLSKEVIIALTGTVAVAVGFALKDLLASIIAGVTIIFDRPFQVGDRVAFAGTYGEVTAIGLRSVRIVTLDDNVVTIPNSKVLTEVVSSGNWGALDMLIQVDFHIAHDEDIRLAKRLVEESITSCRYAYLKKGWRVLVAQEIKNNYMTIRLRAQVYVLDVQYELEFKSEINERVLSAFHDHEIRLATIFSDRGPRVVVDNDGDGDGDDDGFHDGDDGDDGGDGGGD